MTLSRSRTGGGPPSAAVGAAKNRDTEKTLVHSITQEVMGVTSALMRVIVDGIGRVIEPRKESSYAIAPMNRSREQEQSASGARRRGWVRNEMRRPVEAVVGRLHRFLTRLEAGWLG
eukprot:6190050-Pleurochrysis_carterae.AAC.1